MPAFLETTVDKFTFRVATDRLYSHDGLWVLRRDPGGSSRVRIGITDYLQQHSGDMAFVNIKPTGTALNVGDGLADLETIKINLTLPSPIGGAIVASNGALELNPELVNQSPYDQGWLAEIDTMEWDATRASLLDPAAYFELMKTQAQEELKKS